MLYFILSLLLCSLNSHAQQVELDTTFYDGKVWKIVSKRNGKKFGYTYVYRSYTNPPTLDRATFYINNQLFGASLSFGFGEIFRITHYRGNTVTLSKNYWGNGTSSEEIYPFYKSKFYYDSTRTLEFVDYVDLKESVSFYPNLRVKSIIITDSSTQVLTRKYYEFTEEGVLKVEGVFADSFVQIFDTIIQFDPDTYEEIVMVTHSREPLKHGEWIYYSNKGALLEKKHYVYFTERKNKLIHW